MKRRAVKIFGFLAVSITMQNLTYIIQTNIQLSFKISDPQLTSVNNAFVFLNMVVEKTIIREKINLTMISSL